MIGSDDYPWPEMLEEEEQDDFDLGFDFDDDSSSNSPSGTSPSPDGDRKLTGRKRRIRNRRRIYAPRIIKNDIRRHYATMMANVCNSYNDDMYASFLTTFSVPNMRVRKTVLLDLPTDKNFQDSFRHEVISDIGSGLKWSVMYYAVLKGLCPDSVMRILSSELYSRSDTSKTILTIKMRYDFTRLHDVHPLLFTEDMFEALVEGPAKDAATDAIVAPSAAVIRSLGDRANPFDYYRQKMGSDIPLLRKPEKIAFVSNVRIFIDECKRIEMVEIADAEFV